MCGRTCLTLDPKQIQCACKYKIKKVESSNQDEKQQSSSIKSESDEAKLCEYEFVEPEWREEYNLGRKYSPSYNLPPSELSPVLISADHFNGGRQNLHKEHDANKQPQYVLVPMLWSMIPFWHKGDYRKHGLTTNNCRLEQLESSKLYSGPLRRGQRCVVVCEGMYEWQTTTKPKPSQRAAYFIHAPQKDGIKIYDKSSWSSPENLNLLKMAGLFDIWEDENGDKIYSYTVITYESTKILSWLHHRMPAILETEDQVKDWLDYKRVPYKKALEIIKPPTKLEWYRVGNIVNNSRNKSENCNKPIEILAKQSVKSEIVVTPQNKGLLTWLNVRKRREETIAKTFPLSDDEKEEKEGSKATSDSESGLENPPKRPRYRDFKKSGCQTDSNISVSTDSDKAACDEIAAKCQENQKK